jgi:type I restriction enzyme S subunit
MQGLLTGKVRLPGFADRWKIVNLGDLLKERNERDVESEKLLLYSLTIENGVCPKGERYDRSFLVKSDSKVYKKTYKNDIVYNPANLRYGAIAHNKNENPVLLSPIYQVLFVKNEKETNIDFIGQLLTWERQIRKMSAYAEGTLIERMEVKIDSFKTIQIDIPDKKEQDAIANILNTASKEIVLLEEKLSFIQEQKRYLLNNLITGTIRTPETLSTKLTK